MMGRQDDGQDPFLYHFNLDDHIPQDHLLRHIDRVLDLNGLHQHLAAHYSHTGRPSIDPELMIRMLLIGYCFGIRSERRLCEEVQLNLAYQARRSNAPRDRSWKRAWAVFVLHPRRPDTHAPLASSPAGSASHRHHRDPTPDVG